jgi:hypothetical protein
MAIQALKQMPSLQSENAQLKEERKISVNAGAGAIKQLQDEIERLKKENQGLRANSMIQEAVIENGHDPIRDEKIILLTMENSSLKFQTEQLGKQLERAVKCIPHTCNMCKSKIFKGEQGECKMGCEINYFEIKHAEKCHFELFDLCDDAQEEK